MKQKASRTHTVKDGVQSREREERERKLRVWSSHRVHGLKSLWKC